MASLFNLDIKYLKGIGEKRAALFRKIGAPTVGALLRFYPRTYLDVSCPAAIGGAPEGAACAVKAAVVKKPERVPARGKTAVYRAEASDGENTLELTFFNNPYITGLLKEGQEYIFYGKVSRMYGKRRMAAPDFIQADICPPVVPVYRQTQGLSSRAIAKAVRSAMRMLPEVINDPLPRSVRMEYSVCHLRFAVENIHFPSDMASLALARRRLVFEELLVLQLGLFVFRERVRGKSVYRAVRDYSGEFFSMLPFEPTGAQKNAVRQGMSDMMGGYVMNRIVQGDVGSGKTAVAQALCYCAVKNGMQAAVMAPTGILARQHYASFCALFSKCGIKVELLTGSTGAKDRRRVLAGAENGGTDIVIGTHALLSDVVRFKRLGLVVTDEQHRFGVSQRAALAAKGKNPHMLVMSATPIPRTLALMIYGDLDLSVLDEMPPGRKKISTYAVPPSKRQAMFGFVNEQIAQGRQCYIICPMIDGDAGSGMESVGAYAVKLKKWLPGCRAGTLHGRMGAKEKSEVMESFAEGKLDALVSTTVVEVGVDVPNATVMVIENAERYGLSQLHQLRGRVGRGSCKSYCILVSDSKGGEIPPRLKIMCETGDGFKIAEEDLKLRGPGDFFGQRQHGLPELKIACLMTDMDIFNDARGAAQAIIKRSPLLSGEEYKGLRAETRLLFSHMETS